MPCAICMEDIETTNEVITLRCKHCYHGDCIKKWLVQKMSCPTCRSNNVF